MLKQLDEAAKTAQIGVIDMEKLGQFASTEDMASLEELRSQFENLVRELAELPGTRSRPGQRRIFALRRRPTSCSR
ncbi:MAG: hypothetical protein R3C56_05285 [Pirellulaceae bacterium]